jgi:hypothetical protein
MIMIMPRGHPRRRARHAIAHVSHVRLRNLCMSCGKIAQSLTMRETVM